MCYTFVNLETGNNISLAKRKRSKNMPFVLLLFLFTICFTITKRKGFCFVCAYPLVPLNFSIQIFIFYLIFTGFCSFKFLPQKFNLKKSIFKVQKTDVIMQTSQQMTFPIFLSPIGLYFLNVIL